MKCQLLLLAAMCLASVWALPVPDEEVAIQPEAGAKAELLGKQPIEPAPSAKLETEAKIESKTIAAETPKLVEAIVPAAPALAAAPKELSKDAELKLQAPDLETAPAIPEKKILAEEPKPIELEAEKKLQEKTARTEEEPIEAPKAIPLVEAPVANAEVQQQIVDEAKPAVLKAPVAPAGKSAELLPKPLEAEPIKAEEPIVAAELPAKSDLKTAKPDEIILNATPIAAEPALEKKETTAEQPARQERINEIEQKEKLATPVEAVASSELKTELKPESAIQVITPTIKSSPAVAEEKLEAAPVATPAAAPAALAAQAKSAEPEPKQAQPVEQQKNVETVAESAPILKTIEAAEPVKELPAAEIKALKTEEPIVEKKAELPAEPVVAEAKKIDEPAAPIAAIAPEIKLPEPVTKSQETATIEEKLIEPAVVIAPELKKSSEEKTDKSESKIDDSSESKESDESGDSKEN